MASEEGHCFLPEPNLIAQAANILGLEPEHVGPCVEELVREGGVVRETLRGAEGEAEEREDGADAPVTAIYLVPFHRAETSLARGLGQLLASGRDRLPSFQSVNWEAAFGWLQGQTASTLAAEQVEAVKLALTQRVAVLTGGPGCGKSFTVRAIVQLARAKRGKVLLTAPTGRAAKRLEELAGLPGVKASTLHRLL